MITRVVWQSNIVKWVMDGWIMDGWVYFFIIYFFVLSFCSALFAYCSLDQTSIYIIGFEAPWGTKFLVQLVWILICLQCFTECCSFEGKWKFLWNCETDDKVCKGWIQSREDTCQVLLQTCLQSAKWCRLTLSRISEKSRMSQIFWIFRALSYKHVYNSPNGGADNPYGVTISVSHVQEKVELSSSSPLSTMRLRKRYKGGAPGKGFGFSMTINQIWNCMLPFSMASQSDPIKFKCFMIDAPLSS